jgi:plastocyanin
MNRSNVVRIGVVPLATLAFSLVAAGCGDDSEDTSAAASSTQSTPLMIKDFAFSPNPYQAKVGDTVMIMNADDTDHTATAEDGSFDTGSFTGAGAIKYKCDIHNYMTGVIQVSE